MEKKTKKTVPFEHPKQCPWGHKHLSWEPGEEQTYCWDCNRYYPASECFPQSKGIIWREEESPD